MQERVLPFTVGGWLFAGFVRELSVFGGMLMRNLTRSNLDVRNYDISCEYCSYDYQYYRNHYQYLQRFKEISIKKDR